MKFIIDRSTWRTGADGINATGKGFTYLRNDEGFCCCLGQIAEQCNISKDETLGKGTPEDISKYIPFLVEESDGYYVNNDIAKEAMEINDSKYLSLDDKEEKLKELFKHLFDLEFIGEPVRENV